MEKDIKVAELLGSNIFCYNINFDEWPSLNQENELRIRPYNDSLFELKHAHNSIFNKNNEDLTVKDDDETINSMKIFKVLYKINILPCLGEHIC